MTRIQNLEYRIQKVENALRGEDPVVPAGALSGAWNHYGGRVEREPGAIGFKRAECRKGSQICPRKSLITRLTRFNPVQPNPHEFCYRK